MNVEVGMRNAEWKRMGKSECGMWNGKECGNRNYRNKELTCV